MKLEERLQDVQRQLQKRTADEHGEGAELELFEVLKGAFEEDKIRRVQKGTPGADIVHEVMLNGKPCGKIVYDSKNRNKWATELQCPSQRPVPKACYLSTTSGSSRSRGSAPS